MRSGSRANPDRGLPYDFRSSKSSTGDFRNRLGDERDHAESRHLLQRLDMLCVVLLRRVTYDRTTVEELR